VTPAGTGATRADHDLRYAPQANCFTIVARYTVETGVLILTERT
jgi:hypothetical protein